MVRRWSSATSEDEAEASGSSASEQVKSRLQLKAFVVHFKRLDLDPLIGGCPNQIVLVGRSPAHVFWGMPSRLFHVTNNKFNTYVKCYHMFTHL